MKESELGPALAQLFGSAVSIFSAASIFSDLVWHVKDDDFLSSLAEHLEGNQVCCACTGSLRLLLHPGDGNI